MEFIVRPETKRNLPGTQLRLSWRGVGDDDTVAARAETATGAAVEQFDGTGRLGWIKPSREVGVWLVELTQLPTTVTAVEFVVRSRSGREVGVAVEVFGTPEPEVVQHAGATPLAGRAWLVLRLTRTSVGWRLEPLDRDAEDEGVDPLLHVPTPLRPAARRALSDGLVQRGTRVLAVLDLSASMRPWLRSGLVAEALTAAQALAGAAGGSDLPVLVAGLSRGQTLPLGTPAAPFLVQTVGVQGLRTGDRRALLAGATGLGGDDLVVLITDGPPVGTHPGCRVLTLALGAEPAAGVPDTVAVPDQPTTTEEVVQRISAAARTAA